VYFPTYSNSLKEIGDFLGAKWSQATPSGIHTIAWRERWLRTGDPIWKERLLRYNREDCLALKRVAECLDDLIAKQGMPRELRGNTELVLTDTLPRSERKGHVFRKQEFAISDFERINRCAYFDYYRDRFAVRSGRPKKRRERGNLTKRRWKLRLNKVSHLTAKKCPNCRCRKITAGRPIARTIIDLKLSASGIKRWVVRYQSNEYVCEKCRAKFVPGGIPPVSSKFG
jgi:predicted RecB family nuclease